MKTKITPATCDHPFSEITPEEARPWIGTCMKCGLRVELIAIPYEEDGEDDAGDVVGS